MTLDSLQLRTVKETAQLLHIAEITLRQHMQKRTITYFKVGGRCMFSQAHIHDFLSRRSSARQVTLQQFKQIMAEITDDYLYRDDMHTNDNAYLQVAEGLACIYNVSTKELSDYLADLALQHGPFPRKDHQYSSSPVSE